ncbi:MAG: MBL fold metallo-hydrolase [Chromatiales bacterium]
MRFASLGSGSRGNAALIGDARTLLLVDCGFAVRDVEERLGRLGVEASRITAILLTHEHADHASGVGGLARRHRLPVWMTAGTLAAVAQAAGALPKVHVFSNHEPFSIEGIVVQPIAVPHDAREPSQFVFGDGAVRVGLVTDTGSPTPYIQRMLDGVEALLLEFNHDERMLQDGPYPGPLKRRIASSLGHLSNSQSAALLAALDTRRLQHLVAMHLSQQNNSVAIVRDAAAAALHCAPDWIGIADQDLGFGWREVKAGC